MILGKSWKEQRQYVPGSLREYFASHYRLCTQASATGVLGENIDLSQPMTVSQFCQGRLPWYISSLSACKIQLLEGLDLRQAVW